MSADFTDPVWMYVGGAYLLAALGFGALGVVIIGRLTRWARAARMDTESS